MIKTFWPVLFSAFLLLASTTQSFAYGERITDFRSDVVIRADSVAEVTETISVIATGDQIKHGIYRDFPTIYKGKLGNNVDVGFHVTKVLRDGTSIPYSVESLSNGKRIYLGNTKILIAPGPHTYTLSYEADRELGFFSDHDEFYWNVTGNGWVFPIDKAETTIQLPPNARVTDQSAYTGYSGSNGRDYQTSADTADHVSFSTIRPLGPYEGLTVSVSWPKGLVKEPTSLDKVIYFMKDNPASALTAAASLLLFLYYIIVWRTVKATEPLETVIPLFAPPKDLPVPAVSFIYNKDMNPKTLPATIVDLAVKGYLKIVQEKHFLGNIYSLEKVEGASAVLPAVEKDVVEQLFCLGSTLKLQNTNYTIFQGAGTQLNSDLKAEFKDRYFNDNNIYTSHGMTFTVVIAIVALFLTHWTIEVIPAILVGVSFFLCCAFIPLIKSYTKEGKDLQTAIEGFKMFLSVTDKYRFEQMTPPDVTPEVFEKYFPYAVALGVENKWANKFSQYLEAAGQSMQNYQPIWYTGHLGNINQLSSDLGHGLTSAISSSSTPPGGSSGGGGGGSSGGGRGGGGGGGF